MPTPRPLGNTAYNAVNQNAAWDSEDVRAFLRIHYLAALMGNEELMDIARAGVERNLVAVRTQEKVLGNRLDMADELIMAYEAEQRKGRR